MPVVSINKLRENTFLIVWEITESNQELSEMIHQGLHDWNATEKHHENKHWLASRLAILHHFRNEEVDIIKDEFNKPHLKVDEKDVFVSITHSYEKAAVIVSTDHPVSLDLERIDSRIDRVRHKFCNESELKLSDSRHHAQTILTVIWAAKETLYKWYGRKELDFKLHLSVHPFDIKNKTFQIKGSIRKEDIMLDATLTVDINDGYVLTYIA